MINTTNLNSLTYIPASQQGMQTGVRESGSESVAAARDSQQQTSQQILTSDAVNRQYVERLASGTNAAAMSNRSKRAVGLYNSVSQYQERDYVSRVLGIDAKA